MESHDQLPPRPLPGIASLEAVALLLNPRRGIPGSPLTVVFDMQVYIGPTPDKVLIGCVRYFNESKNNFNDVGLYRVVTTFARREVGIHTVGAPSTDYNFVGDIEWLTHLGPGSHYLGNGERPKTFIIDACKPSVLHISGVATKCQGDRLFELHIKQYISCFKDSSSPSMPMTAFKCVFPNSGKFKNKTPMPWNKEYVTVLGSLTGVEKGKGSEQNVVQHFNVDIRKIALLGGEYPHNRKRGNDDGAGPAASSTRTPESSPRECFCRETGGQYMPPVVSTMPSTSTSQPPVTTPGAFKVLFSYAPITSTPTNSHNRTRGYDDGADGEGGWDGMDVD